MLLKCFNIKEVITNHNRQYNTNYDKNESFGFHYFVSENLERANLYLDLINQGSDAYIFSKEGGKYIKEVNKEIHQVKLDLPLIKSQKKSKRGAILNNTPYTLEEIQYYTNENLKNKKWSDKIKEQAAIFSDEKFWTTNINVANIEQATRLWIKNNQLACFNDTTIYKIAIDTLPALIKYHQEANEELLNHKQFMPKQIYTAYIEYLKDFEERARKMQNLLVDSMLTRLKAYDVSKSAYSNPVVYIYDIVNPSFETPHQPISLKPKEFDFYHQYANLHGTNDQKKQLLERSWFTTKNNIATKIIKTVDDELSLVPESLAKDIPTKKRWPNWLFWGANLRHNFFKKNISLMAALKNHIEIKGKLVDSQLQGCCKNIFNQIKEKEAVIQRSIKSLEASPYNDIPWYSFTTKRFFKQWKNILFDQEMKVIKDKILLAEKLTHSLRLELQDPQLVSNISWEISETLIELTKDLKELIQRQDISAALQDRIFIINSTIVKLNALNKYYRLLECLAGGIPITSDKLDDLLKFIDHVKKEDPQIVTSFLKYCKPQIDNIYCNLINELKIDPFSINSLDGLQKNQNKIINMYYIIQKVGTEDYKLRLDNKIKKHFLRFLQSMITKDETQCKAATTTCENILSSIGKNIIWHNMSLCEHMAELKNCKSKSNRLFRTSCMSLINSFGNDLLEQHFTKELIKFDNEIIKILQNEPFNYSDLTIRSLLNSEHESFSGNKLSRSEKVLLSVTHPEFNQASHLIKASVNAHQVASSLSNNDLLFKDKSKMVTELSKSISRLFANNPSQAESTRKKRWFTKQYVADDILESKQQNSLEL